MNPLRCFPSAVNAQPTDAPLIDWPEAPRPASQVCMGLVWQALARVKSVTLQVVRHLDCRQGLPAESLQPPSSYEPVSSTPVDADAPVQAAVQVAVHAVVEMAADAGAAPVKPAESSEPAAEERPHDAPPSPAPSPEAPSPLKSIALPVLHAKRTRSVTVTDQKEIRLIPGRSWSTPRLQPSLSSAPVETATDESSHSNRFFVDPSSLDYELPALSSSPASVQTFKGVVQTHLFWLSSYADDWSDPEKDHSLDMRLSILDNTLEDLEQLAQAVERLKTDLESGQAGDMDAGDSQRLLEFLDDKQLDLRANEARMNGLKAGFEFLLRAKMASGSDQPLVPCISETSTDDDSDSGYQGLDFSRINDFSQGGAGIIVKGMRGAIVRLLDEISDLKEEAGERGQTLDGQILAVEGIVEKLGELHRVLSDNLNAYIGRNYDFEEWMYEKMDDIHVELQEWERALDRLRAQPGAGPQPG